MADQRQSQVGQATSTASARPNPAKKLIIKPVVSVLSHKTLTLATVVIVFALGFPMAQRLSVPVYRSGATIHVSPRFVRILENDKEVEFQSHSQYLQFLEQQGRMIGSYDTVKRALERLSANDRAWTWEREDLDETLEQAAERLCDEIVAKPVRNSYLVSVSLEAQQPQYLAEIVNTIVDIYLENAKSEHVYAEKPRVQVLEQEKLRLDQELAVLSEKRTTIAARTGVSTFSQSGFNTFDQLVLSSRDAVAAATRRRIEAATRLNAINPDNGAHAVEALDALAMQMVAVDIGLHNLRGELYKRRGPLLTTLSGLAANHPGRDSIEKEVKAIDAEVADATATTLEGVRARILKQHRTDAEVAGRVEDELKAQLLELESNSTQYAKDFQEADRLDGEMTRISNRITMVEDRVLFFQFEESAPGFVRLDESARVPELPSKGGGLRYYLLLLIGAILLSIVTPVAADYFDPRVISPPDLDRVLGFSPMGWILEKRGGASVMFAEDQLRRLANRIQQERRATKTKVFLLTSPKPGAGVTTLALELALELQRLGVKALALEANVFQPDQRYQSSRPLAGLIDVLATPERLGEAIAPATDTQPERIAVGETEGARRLPNVHALASTLEQLVEEFEVVLMDAPPVLLSADAEMLVPYADATVLVVEARGNLEGEVARAAKVIERLEPAGFGVVLNRARIFRGGGYYSSLLKEYRSGKRAAAPKWSAPWLWK